MHILIIAALVFFNICSGSDIDDIGGPCLLSESHAECYRVFTGCRKESNSYSDRQKCLKEFDECVDGPCPVKCEEHYSECRAKSTSIPTTFRCIEDHAKCVKVCRINTFNG
ncbi:uncharacterized protein LOC100203959 [Hydra vulgaris]|uniref:uncharacterized protein LOC100203959 n=1 Tax=Hydra vulgaris TaxID=6087 RepID=UPI0001925CC6|nr:uncharacterized protein LOC100203959 [Hydra vulgaris]